MNIQETLSVINMTLNKEIDRVDVLHRVRFVDTDLSEGDEGYERGVSTRAQTYVANDNTGLDTAVGTTEASSVRSIMGWS